MLARHAAIAAALLAAAAPSSAAIIYQTSTAFSGGQAFLSDYLTVPQVLTSGSTWVGVSLGTIDYGGWTIDGEEAKLWWEPIPTDDGEIPYLNGNEYLWSPTCSSTLGAPACSDGGALSTLLSGNLLRGDLSVPPSFNTCYPFNGVYYVDCADSFTVNGVAVDLSVLARVADGTSVTFTFYDADPTVVPEPAAWAMMIAGFGLVGAALRRRKGLAAA